MNRVKVDNLLEFFKNAMRPPVHLIEFEGNLYSTKDFHTERHITHDASKIHLIIDTFTRVDYSPISDDCIAFYSTSSTTEEYKRGDRVKLFEADVVTDGKTKVHILDRDIYHHVKIGGKEVGPSTSGKYDEKKLVDGLEHALKSAKSLIQLNGVMTRIKAAREHGFDFKGLKQIEDQVDERRLCIDLGVKSLSKEDVVSGFLSQYKQTAGMARGNASSILRKIEFARAHGIDYPEFKVIERSAKLL